VTRAASVRKKNARARKPVARRPAPPATSLVLYFQVHQPWRLRTLDFFDIGRGAPCFDDALNGRLLRRVADRCYLPANARILSLVRRTRGRFRCAFSLSGTALAQMERWAPDALASFRALAATGCVEFLGETSHHSLSFLGDPGEFRRQVAVHRDMVDTLLGVTPRAFRNTELVFDGTVARAAEEMGFDTLLGEGADHLLGWSDPYGVYRPRGCERLRLLLRCYRLSDDIAFRFASRSWEEWPLTPAKFVKWLYAVPRGARHVGLFMDYETVGEHQSAETGILDFLEDFPGVLARGRRFRFRTPTEAAALVDDPLPLDAPRPVSWADFERDLSAWLGNDMQRAAHEALYALGPAVRRAARRRGDHALLEDWRRLTTSDHVYYMCTKWASDGDVHAYFSHWPSPHEAHRVFMNVLDDIARRAGVAPPVFAATPIAREVIS
jgi:alpha-amylase